ncbi:CvpA family protein [Poseidonocella sp. HB161398]|uniref:CvpA family protein n=1 Tax=Poseidonocella sp. HB161398 TaxID=2320855 RepID=UPI001107CBF7|nr:CvpA family protein [Poseidonocella sp. HB161398]
MDGFTLLDAGVAIVILLSALLAYSRGIVHESLAILGWVAAAVVAYLFAHQVEPLVREIPYVGQFLQDSCELSIIAAFCVVFGLCLIVVSIFSPLFASLVKNSALGGIDQGLGFLFGALRGILLVAVALLVYDRVVVSSTFPIIDDSRTARVFAGAESGLESTIPTDVPGWILGRYEALVGTCGL